MTDLDEARKRLRAHLMDSECRLRMTDIRVVLDHLDTVEADSRNALAMLGLFRAWHVTPEQIDNLRAVLNQKGTN